MDELARPRRSRMAGVARGDRAQHQAGCNPIQPGHRAQRRIRLSALIRGGCPIAQNGADCSARSWGRRNRNSHNLPWALVADLASALVIKPASTTIPIVFSMGADPVKLGLVGSLNRPGGNITGVSFLSTALVAKTLEMLHEVVPNAVTVAAFVNPANPSAEAEIREAQEASHILGVQLYVLHASTEREIDAAFATLIQRQAKALIIAGDTFLGNRIDQLAADGASLSSRHLSIPDICRRGRPDELWA